MFTVIHLVGFMLELVKTVYNIGYSKKESAMIQNNGLCTPTIKETSLGLTLPFCVFFVNFHRVSKFSLDKILYIYSSYYFHDTFFPHRF